ncbi:bifunctional DnaQ family exonuclease/ATP-dependent helicase [Streptococcus catagoni]|uniref:bifunctional DnaQ family exonuclease/ATP-dependent helicase n=1 Tax=Streptococcus catagoni TaxID=2654874 RepID=UPI00140A7D03|nr:bifunctional DnaQ family exonuclease/ATP-dependent helicase [Streptococcus catagoni]
MTNESKRKYAVIDLEATNAGSTASIIQVGIVIIENQEIITTYQTDVNPHEPLSEHIKSLTGISDQQLAKAPEFSQVAGDIFSLIQDCIFIAHNVKFDANLLAEALFMEGYELRTPRIDTVELAQVFFPSLEKYNLSNLSENLDLHLSDAHTAIADAMATAKLFLKIQEKIKSLPTETIEELVRFKDSLIFETGLVIEEALATSKSYSKKQFVKMNSLLVRKKEASLRPLKLSQKFEINVALLGLEERPLQEKFAKLVDSSFQEAFPSFIEAQAGIGKTYGYLLPLLAKAEGKQILVSVPTKILQDQMMVKELHSLKENYQIDCHSLKGPANYLKLDSFEKSLAHLDDNSLVNRYKMQLLVWLLETETGDLDEIKQKQRFAAYFEQLEHDGEVPLSSPFYDYDFWRRSYEKAKNASVLLTNHAYFLHRVEDDKDFAKGKILVFDEAQRLVIQLENLSRRKLNLTALLQELKDQLPLRGTLLEKRLLESLSFEFSQLVSNYYQNNQRLDQIATLENVRSLVKELPLEDFTHLKDFFKDEEADYWLNSQAEADKRITYLNRASRYFINFNHFLPETLKTYFISATLQISPQVSLANLLGFDAYSYAKIDKDKTANQLVVIDQDMPLISELTDLDYSQEIANRITSLKELQKPILVLFNSRKHMLMVSDLLDQWNISHLTQEKNGNATNIKNRFDRGEQGILLGMGAFWEGVDFIHADRMIEVITRLPFDNPKDQFLKKMNAYLSSQGKSPFKDYFLPMAILKLKQAIGRTMRRDNQKSAIVILDKRILTKTYGQQIMESLEGEFLLSQEKFKKSLVSIDHFLI